MYLNTSYQTLRRLLGELGILLPLALYVFNGFRLEPSISDCYYTQAGTVFTGILVAFGLFLLTYRGHRKNKLAGQNEWVSDNFLTNVGGILALITVLVPTSFGEDWLTDCRHPLCHNTLWINLVHLGSAAGFLAIMGGMAYFKFTLNPKEVKWKLVLFRTSGLIVWTSLLLMGIYIYLKNRGLDWFPNAIFWGETLSLLSFGSAWLVNGHPENMWLIKQFNGDPEDKS